MISRSVVWLNSDHNNGLQDSEESFFLQYQLRKVGVKSSLLMVCLRVVLSVIHLSVHHHLCPDTYLCSLLLLYCPSGSFLCTLSILLFTVSWSRLFTDLSLEYLFFFSPSHLTSWHVKPCSGWKITWPFHCIKAVSPNALSGNGFSVANPSLERTCCVTLRVPCVLRFRCACLLATNFPRGTHVAWTVQFLFCCEQCL